MTTAEDTLRQRALKAGQGHVFRFWQELDGPSRARLLTQVEALDFALIEELGGHLTTDAGPAPAPKLEPPELFPLARTVQQEADAAAAVERGRELLACGEVGFVLVAGGQASRLGYDGPKGAYPIGPVSQRPLFAFHAHRLRAAAARHGCPTPWYVMTSPANDALTREFFAQHGFFGLAEDELFFFQQEVLPALDESGRILMAAKDSAFLAPSGHGGTLSGLARSGALADMRRRGVTRVSYFQVDNPLARPADPLFLGLHALAGAGMSSKVVRKRDAREKVGVLGRIDARLGCIEYSDLPRALREQRDTDGELSFRAGNIAVHLLDVAFVEELTAEKLRLPWHLAQKKMRVVDERGALVERAGAKFETFIFDALARSSASVTLEVDRALEFSPVKNATGEDSPASCRADLCRLFAGWAAEAGRALPAADANGLHPIEIDPVIAEDQAEFCAQTELEPHVDEHGHLYA